MLSVPMVKDPAGMDTNVGSVDATTVARSKTSNNVLIENRVGRIAPARRGGARSPVLVYKSYCVLTSRKGTYGIMTVGLGSQICLNIPISLYFIFSICALHFT